MTEPGDEHERTMAFAEIALGQIKALRQPAIPRNYEVWYAYATGYNPSLNQTINETLAQQRHAVATPTSSTSTTTYISPSRFTDRIDKRRHPGDGRDRPGHGDDRRRRRLRRQLHREPRRRDRASSATPRTATACAPSSRAWCGPPTRCSRTTRRWKQRLNASKQEINQLQENLEAVRTESLTDPLTTLANRKYLRRRARQGDRRSAPSATSRCR